MTAQLPKRSNGARWVTLAFITVGIVLLFVLFWPMVALWARATVFSHIVDGIGQWTHWDSRIVTGFVLLLILPLFWALGYLIRIRLPAFRSQTLKTRGRLRFAAYGCVVLYASAFYLVTGFASRDIYFGRDGQPLKYCVEKATHLYCEDTPGYDPDGNPLVPVTREMVSRQRQRATGKVPGRIQLADLNGFDRTVFIGPDGRARVWAGQSLTGEAELFDSPGYHPTTGEPLTEVTPELLRSIRGQLAVAARQTQDRQHADENLRLQSEKRAKAQLEEARMAQYIDSRVRTAGRPAVLVANSDGDVCGECMEIFRRELGVDRSLFRPAFLAAGPFARAAEGDVSALDELGLREYPGYILLVRERGTIVGDQLDQSLRRVELVYEGYLFTGRGPESIRARGQAADFNETRALEKARLEGITKLVQAVARH